MQIYNTAYIFPKILLNNKVAYVRLYTYIHSLWRPFSPIWKSPFLLSVETFNLYYYSFLASFARITDRAVYTASQPSTESIDGDALAVITISTWIQTQTPFKTI